MILDEVNCNLCGKSGFRIIEKEGSYFVLRCQTCTLVFVYPHPHNTNLQTHYDDAYYEKWLNAQSETRKSMWVRRLKKLEKFRRGGRLLDVGCGEGSFLKLAQRRGWDVAGTELSSYAAEYASKSLGVCIFCGELGDAGFTDNSFDVVTMWHVLEHVCDPKNYLKEIHRILRPGGLLVLAVPNVKNFVMQIAYRIIKRRRLRLFSEGDKEIHLYHFSPVTMEAYLKRTHFQCIRLGPDFGIVERSKRLANVISVIPYYLAGIKIFNAIEIFAVCTEGDFHQE